MCFLNMQRHVHKHSPCLFCQYLQTEVKGFTNAHTRYYLTFDWSAVPASSLTDFYHQERSNPSPAKVPIEGAVLFKLSPGMTYLSPFIQACISNVNIEEYFKGGN